MNQNTITPELPTFETDNEYLQVDERCALAFSLRNNDNQRAQVLCAEAKNIALRNSYTRGLVEVEYVQGVCDTCNAEYDKALTRLFYALEQAQHHEFQAVEARILRWIGITYIRIGMHTTALEYLSKSRHLSEDLHDTLHEGQCWNNIGDVYYGLADYKSARGYYHESFRLLEQFGDTEQKGVVLYSIASASLELGEYRRALLYFQQSLALRIELHDEVGIAATTAGIADVYGRQGHFDTALDLLFRVLDTATGSGHTIGTAWTCFQIGTLYLTNNKPDKAIEYFLRSEQHTNEKVKNLLSELHRGLARAYKALGQMEEAYRRLELCYTIREELVRHDNKQAIRYIQHGFEMEKTRQEAEIYRLRNVELARANQKNEDLLRNILPGGIVHRLQSGETTIADRFNAVSVLFADIAGFTQLSSTTQPEELVALLDTIFTDFDGIANRYALEKIKTIGDCYMLVGGLPEPCHNHLYHVALAALDLRDSITRLQAALDLPLAIRIGLHAGEVVAGVIGKKKFAYDLWGDTVNTASRMESSAEPGTIHVTHDVFQQLSAHTIQLEDGATMTFTFHERGWIDIKGKGMMQTYYLTGTR